MDDIRSYFISVFAAAILCGIIKSIATGMGNKQGIIQLFCGLFLVLTVIRPITDVKLNDLIGFWNEYRKEAAAAVSAGQAYSREMLEDIIKEETEAYILDRAQALDAKITVQISVSEKGDPLPESVCIQGKVSYGAKKQLQQIIARDIGIGKERQIWIPS